MKEVVWKRSSIKMYFAKEGREVGVYTEEECGN